MAANTNAGAQNHQHPPRVVNAEVVDDDIDPDFDDTSKMIPHKRAEQGGHAVAPRVTALELEAEGVDAAAGIPLYEEDLGPENNKKFVKRGFQDVWAIPLFFAVILTTIGAAAYLQISAPPHQTRWYHDSYGGTVLPALGLAAASSIGVALLSLTVMRASPVGYIFFAHGLIVLWFVFFAMLAFKAGSFYGGGFNLFLAGVSIFWIVSVADRVPFAAHVLHTSVRLNMRHWGSFVVGLGALVFMLAFATAWSVVFEAMARASVRGNDGGQSSSSSSQRGQHDDNAGNAVAGIASFLMTFVLFWAIQTGANVVHVTASGVVATWYFVGEQRMPKTAVPANLKRSLTTSFGSICFGSAVVALLKTIYYFLRSAVRSSRAHILVKLIAMCLIGIIERLTEMFNIYAFTQVAIYGHDFVTAAKQTFALVKESGWSLIINDCLVWRSLAITNLVCSLGLCVVFWIAFNPIVGLLTLAVALSVFTIFFRPVYAGIATQFVCIAENPTAMEVANPEWAATTNALKPQDVGNQETGGDQRPVQRV